MARIVGSTDLPNLPNTPLDKQEAKMLPARAQPSLHHEVSHEATARLNSVFIQHAVGANTFNRSACIHPDAVYNQTLDWLMRAALESVCIRWMQRVCKELKSGALPKRQE